jgi:hypothetical protein
MDERFERIRITLGLQYSDVEEQTGIPLERIEAAEAGAIEQRRGEIGIQIGLAARPMRCAAGVGSFKGRGDEDGRASEILSTEVRSREAGALSL